MGVYGIELFFSKEAYFGYSYLMYITDCGVIQPCGVQFFILLANGIR